ncbi:MAG: hypothetical protein ACTSPI_12295 [Candidatus Heimdallarchaeaceae archaeon]
MSYIKDKTIEMRCNRAYVRTIHNWVISQCPLLDEIVCLSRVLTTLDDKNLPYSRKEVRTAFNRYYNKKYHGSATSYLYWLCKNCSRKVVFPSKLKSNMKSKCQVKNKTPVAVTSEHNNAQTTHKLSERCLDTPNPSPSTETLHNPHQSTAGGSK